MHTRAHTQHQQRLEGMEGMEDKEARAALNKLIRAAMPKVVGLVAEKRKLWGDEHVTECQRRGMAGEAGWFFAREGTIAIGTPWGDFADANFWQVSASQGFMVMRNPPTQQVHDGKA